MNIAKCDEPGRERVRRAREQSLEWAATFRRLARAALARGGSVSFGWPRYCEGWKQPLIVDMLRDLDLHAVPVDGCAAGLTDQNGTPLFKPWLIAVSSTALVEELRNFRCDKNHEHGKIAGDETAKTAYYPRALCEAIHRGLDAHELHRQARDIPAATAEASIRNQLTLSSAAVTVYGPDASNRNLLTLNSAAVTVYDLAGGTGSFHNFKSQEFQIESLKSKEMLFRIFIRTMTNFKWPEGLDLKNTFEIILIITMIIIIMIIMIVLIII